MFWWNKIAAAKEVCGVILTNTDKTNLFSDQLPIITLFEPNIRTYVCHSSWIQSATDVFGLNQNEQQQKLNMLYYWTDFVSAWDVLTVIIQQYYKKQFSELFARDHKTIMTKCKIPSGKLMMFSYLKLIKIHYRSTVKEDRLFVLVMSPIEETLLASKLLMILL